MNWTKLTIAALLMLTLHQTTQAQTGNWAKAGNSLNGTEKLGSTNGQPVRFFSKNLQRMTLDTNGRLGIGTAKPVVLLHVFRGSAGITPNLDATIATERNADNFINILAPATNQTGVFFG